MTIEGKRKLIFIPYAEIVNAESGVNISAKSARKEIYLKNCCVSLVSAKAYNDCDVALVTNIDVPEQYKKVLEANGVLILKCEFDQFLFGLNYKWNLAFYKLCALYHISREYEYDFYSYLDADVYVKASFNDIWDECSNNILLYDICHGLQVRDYRIFLDEVRAFNGYSLITHFGGEFFAANREQALAFSDRCLEIHKEMIQKDFLTTKGDEFILSIAAYDMKQQVKNAGAYIYRYWTDINFRLVSTNYMYNPVAILHVPNEKEKGLLEIYDKYIRINKIPETEKVYNMLRIKRQPMVDVFKKKIRGMMKK